MWFCTIAMGNNWYVVINSGHNYMRTHMASFNHVHVHAYIIIYNYIPFTQAFFNRFGCSDDHFNSNVKLTRGLIIET